MANGKLMSLDTFYDDTRIRTASCRLMMMRHKLCAQKKKCLTFAGIFFPCQFDVQGRITFLTYQLIDRNE